MSNFFSLDNKFMIGFNKVVDAILLNMLWVLFCIPIFTIGAATTAFYYTMNKTIIHSRSYIWTEFWGAFKREFKQSTLAWLILMAVYILIAYDLYIMVQMGKIGKGNRAFNIFFFVMLFVITMWNIYIFPYIARFYNKLKAILKNAALMALMNLPWTLLLLVLFVVIGLGVYVIPFAILFLPAIYMFLAVKILERVFAKYMTPEQLEEEEERNREYFN